MQNILSIPFFAKFTDLIPIREYDFEHGNPGLLGAEVEGKQVIVKYWLNRHQDKTEILKEIWLYEKRQLQRLKGCPGVGDYISPIHESHADEHGFYLVLDSGSRLPLSLYYESTSRTLHLQRPWIFNLRPISNRLRFWKNISRIISAINILHSQGLLHRHLNIDSILTDPTSDLDFQLTGFEWSIRVQRMSESDTTRNTSTDVNRKHFSFLTDWMDLGFLIAKILKIDQEEISSTYHPIDKIIEKTELTINEVVLIRGLIGAIDIDKSASSKVINSDIALKKIKDITTELNSLLEKSPDPMAIAFLFNTSSTKGQHSSGKTSVFNAVQHIFFENHSISLSETDIPELLDFISQDLTTSSITKISHNNGEFEYLLIGSQLSYIIGKNKSNRLDPEGSWNTAFCHSAYLTPPIKLGQRNQKVQINRHIKCVVHTNRVELERLNPYPWSEYIDNLDFPATKDEVAKDLTTGFAAYHLTEIAFAKAEIYPIEVISYTIDSDDPSLYNVKLRTRIDPEAESVSQSLSIKSPAVRLKQIFTNSGEYSRWFFLSNSNFNDEDHEIVLDYLSSQQNNGEITYEFTTNTPNPDHKAPFIITSSTQGTISQLSRRAAAIDALSHHDELIELLKSPHRRIMNSNENVTLHDSFNELDSSKRDVFQKVLNTLPLYLVQGPPGVGKTYLVTTLVQQVFSSEANSRLLLTAQSHSTVHHLFNEVNKALGRDNTQNPLLVISCVKNGSPEDDADPNLKVDELAKEQINNLISSSLFKSCPSESTKNGVIALSTPGNRSGRSTLVNQLLKSANLVFATTNSKQVEDLIRSNSQFDWSIMEETGKVTGLELLSPMLLSHRRLMIGDHKQLPPYASEVMRKALGDVSSLKKSLQFSQEIYNDNIKGEFVKNKLTQESIDNFSEQDLEDICREALRLHLLFESLINEEEIALKRSKDHYGHEGRHKPIASMLEIQHRMHPIIAEVVSDVFYKHKLDTSDEKKEFYTEQNKPFYFETADFKEINSAPIVWIETPDVQANQGVKSGDRKPQWNNPFEVEAVVNLLKLLRRKPGIQKPPKLALLSPYNKQIERISTMLDRESQKILNLLDFSKPDDSSSFCSTIDAFQGAEADLTIISLVRNNSDSYPLSALGILLDSRRMNVLLSRAKHQLVIVGSYEFLKHWAKKVQREEMNKGNTRNEFLVILISKLESLKSSKHAVFISSDKFKSDPAPLEPKITRKRP